MKTWLKPLVPAPVRRWLRCTFGWRWLRGDYASWAEARAASAGYDNEAVFERALTAARAVRAGRAAFERDGVTLAEPSVHAPLLAALRRIAAAEGGRLDLVDFGGAFGSTWWQHRAELGALAAVRWRVVEQPRFVEAGWREFAGGVLEFFPTLDAACADGAPVAILLSAVLPYVEEPRGLLAEAVRRRFAHVVIDRTGFISRGRDRLAVQHVPPKIGAASYPCWLFDRASLLAVLAPDYAPVDEWTVAELDGRHDYRGFYFQRRPGATP